MLNNGTRVTRAQFLSMMAAPLLVQAPRPLPAGAEQRIADVIRAYDLQGFHRTATAVDAESARWLLARAGADGVSAGIEPFTLDRVDIDAAVVEFDGRRAEGLPLFDGTFTGAGGIDDVLGPVESKAPIVLTTLDAAAVQSEGRSIAALRRSPSTRAIVAITKGARAGLTPANAVDFTAPYGVPVLQVGSEHEAWLTEAAAANQRVRVTAAARRTAAAADNVVARVSGERSDLAPVVVITPRSGWWHCAGERGGGLACWLEAIRAAAATRAPRPVWFLASSGHELGHLGLDHFIDERKPLVKDAVAWIHLGANIGATDGAARLQASDDEIAALATAALAQAGAKLDRQVPRGTVPGGEARNIHVGGGRYVSLLGTSPFFHNLADRFPAAVDVAAVARYAAAIIGVMTQLRRA